MSRGSRHKRDERRGSARETEFWTGQVGQGGWRGDEPDDVPLTGLIPGQVMDRDAALLIRPGPSAVERCRLRCKTCGVVVGLVIEGSFFADGPRCHKLIVNGGHAVLEGQDDYRFAFTCCGWLAHRTGFELLTSKGTIHLP